MIDGDDVGRRPDLTIVTVGFLVALVGHGAL